jgi:hypothetical protein
MTTGIKPHLFGATGPAIRPQASGVARQGPGTLKGLKDLKGVGSPKPFSQAAKILGKQGKMEWKGQTLKANGQPRIGRNIGYSQKYSTVPRWKQNLRVLGRKFDKLAGFPNSKEKAGLSSEEQSEMRSDWMRKQDYEWHRKMLRGAMPNK